MTHLPIKVYRASAGSGKTYTLAVEYIAHLIGGAQWSQDERRHRHILAITFTNKATAEMKERILDFLLGLSQGRNADVARAVNALNPIPDGQIAERARLAMLAIIHDYDNFHVRTIDTFFQRMLSSLAHELGQSATFRVDINDDEVISDAVDLLLSRLNDKQASNGNNNQVRDWIRQYIRARINENENWKLPDEIKSFARANVLSEAFQSSETDLRKFASDNASVADYRKKIQAMQNVATTKIKKLATKATHIAEIANSAPPKSLKKGCDSIIDFINKVCGGDINAQPTKTILEAMAHSESLLYKGARNNVAAQASAEEISRVFTEFYNALQEQIFIVNSCKLTLKNLNPLRLLSEISTSINEVNREHNRLLLAQTKLLFHEMVRGQDAPFIFEKTGTRYRNILIDEFQDTARTQWDNLHKLLLDKAAAGEDALLVGDVKQSIYRWNGGDWRILQNISKSFIGGVEEKDLDVNYRSQQAIVLFNNTLFRMAAEEIERYAARKFGSNKADDVTQLYTGVEQQTCSAEGDGYVSLYLDTTNQKLYAPLQKDGEELQPHHLAAQMQRLYDEGIPWEQMCILVRRNGEAQTLLENFTQNGISIPLISDEAFLLSSSQAVMLIIAALRYIVKRADTVSQTYLARIYQNDVLGNHLSASELATRREELLPEEFTEHTDELAAMPLYELCLRLSDIFKLKELCGKPETQGQAAFLTSFLDEIVNFLADSNSPTVEHFLEMWDKRIKRAAIPSSEANGVRIMTIHKAKGLAFHTLFVPFCQWELVDSKNRNIIWWKIEDKNYAGPPLVPITANKTCANSIYARQYALECLQQMVDNLNLMYVAFTRPKQNMLVWANAHSAKVSAIDAYRGFEGENAPIANVGQLLHRVCSKLPDELYGKCKDGREVRQKVTVSSENEGFMTLEIGTLSASSKQEEGTKSLQLKYSPRRSRAQFVQSSNAATFVGSADDTQENIEHGLLYHRLFEEFHSASDIEPSLRRMADAGILPHSISYDEIASYAHERIDGAQARPEVREWFDGSWRLHNEAAIIMRDTHGALNTIRPDRVMERDGKTIVVDYKFARPAEGHKTQVKTYMKALLSMGKTDVQGFLWYVDRNEIVQVNL